MAKVHRSGIPPEERESSHSIKAFQFLCELCQVAVSTVEETWAVTTLDTTGAPLARLVFSQLSLIIFISFLNNLNVICLR